MAHTLVTGATTGIGRAFANHLTRQDCNLTLVARTPATLRQVARVCNGNGGFGFGV